MGAGVRHEKWMRCAHYPSAIIATAALAVLLAVPALADKRVAMVIGNSAYQFTRPLRNPKNDAEAVAKVLRDIGFDVTVRTDQGYDDMRRALRDFTSLAQGADIAVIHYAGHGLELAGENYLLPVDAKVARDGDLEYEAVTLTSVLASVRGATRLRLVILDACRNNPLGDRMALSAGATRAVPRGLARIEPSGDVLVAYSAKHGTLAQDGPGPLSPYAEALVKHLATPGLDIRLVMGRVRDAVMMATRREQEPFTYGSIGGLDVHLVPSLGSPGRDPQPVSSQSLSSEVEATAAAAWGSIKNTKSILEIEAYVRAFGNTFHGDLARKKLTELQQEAMLQKEKERKAAEDAAKNEAEAAAAARRDAAETVEPGSGQSFRDRQLDGQICPNCPDMIIVPVGVLEMGASQSEISEREASDAERPRHKVQFSKPFAIGKYEVTFDEWDACVADNGCRSFRPGDNGWGRGRRPVINVSREDARSYAIWLSKKTGKQYRLPSEAEWEYSARGGSMTKYYFGDDAAQLCAHANVADESGRKVFSMVTICDDGYIHTAPVGSFRPNKFGLHDMLGNVMEWVDDTWHDSYEGAPVDGTAWITYGTTADDAGVGRGGRWSSLPAGARTSWRGRLSLHGGGNLLGFRVVRVIASR